MDNILFIFGPARGGTTYVGTVMKQYLDYGTGPEGSFIPGIVKRCNETGDLSNDNICKKFASELSHVEMLEIIRKRWPKEISFDVKPEDIISRMTDRTVASAIYATFKAVADYQEKERIGTKYPDFWKHLPLLDKLFGNRARYLFVIRDGRDVALSLQNVPWGGHSPYEAAKIWRDMVCRVEIFTKTINPNHIYTIKYEELLRSPYNSLNHIAKFLDVKDPEKACLEFEKDTISNKKNRNFEKWKTRMSDHDINVYESVAGKYLEKHGYARKYPNAMTSKPHIIKYEIKRLNRLILLNIKRLKNHV